MRLGVDVGGTKIEAVAIGERGEELFRARVPTPRPADELSGGGSGSCGGICSGRGAGDVFASAEVLALSYRDTLRAIAGLVERAAEAAGDGASKRLPVGVGIPGAVDAATGFVKNANSTWLIGRPMVEDLSAELGRAVRVSNDANCFALSEWADGAGARLNEELGGSAKVLFGVILGTGVGAGVVVNGRIIEGANRVGGEWGHNQLPFMSAEELAASPRCYCGSDAFGRMSAQGKGSGCIETWCSGPALERDFAASVRTMGIASGLTGLPVLRASQIAAIAEGESPNIDGYVVNDELRKLAVSAVDRVIDRLGRALAGVINIIDPDVIVLGGGVGQIRRLYDPANGVLAAAGRWVFGATGRPPADTGERGGAGANAASVVLRTRVVPPVHGDSSGVRGAARLWDDGAVGG